MLNNQPISLTASLFLDDWIKNSEKAKKYISDVKSYGFTGIFSSIHLPEQNFDDSIDPLINFSQYIQSQNLIFILDISANEIRHLYNNTELYGKFMPLKTSFLRLDFGFNDIDIEFIVKKLGINGIVLNASVLMEAELDQLINKIKNLNNKVDLRACHNFYPRPETGISIKFLIHQSNLYKKYQIPVAACVASHNEPRGPLFMGLPTVEKFRYITPCYAAKELIATGVIDEIMIGDPYANTRELLEVREITKHRVVSLRILLESNISEIERGIALDNIHEVRPDQADYVIRSQTTREMAPLAISVPKRQMKDRYANSVTIDNEDYLRYSGELQIILKSLPADSKVNVIGRIYPDDIHLLKYVRPGMPFILKEYRGN
jgi:hypothetical protein